MKHWKKETLEVVGLGLASVALFVGGAYVSAALIFPASVVTVPVYKTPFAFDPSPSSNVQYRVYWGATTNFNMMTNVVDIGTNTSVIITTPYLFVYAYATAYSGEGESVPSNLAGVVGADTIITRYSQTNANLLQPNNWHDEMVIATITNPPNPQMFYRERIEAKTKLRTIP